MSSKIDRALDALLKRLVTAVAQTSEDHGMLKTDHMKSAVAMPAGRPASSKELFRH